MLPAVDDRIWRRKGVGQVGVRVTNVKDDMAICDQTHPAFRSQIFFLAQALENLIGVGGAGMGNGGGGRVSLFHQCRVERAPHRAREHHHDEQSGREQNDGGDCGPVDSQSQPNTQSGPLLLLLCAGKLRRSM